MGPTGRATARVVLLGVCVDPTGRATARVYIFSVCVDYIGRATARVYVPVCVWAPLVVPLHVCMHSVVPRTFVLQLRLCTLTHISSCMHIRECSNTAILDQAGFGLSLHHPHLHLA